MSNTRRTFVGIAIVGTGLACSPAAKSSVASAVPDPGFARGIATADSLISASVGSVIPGAVFLVAKDGRVAHERAFGHAQLTDYEGRRLATPRLMRASTVFDLASVTKVMATTMATMLLVPASALPFVGAGAVATVVLPSCQ